MRKKMLILKMNKIMNKIMNKNKNKNKKILVQLNLCT